MSDQKKKAESVIYDEIAYLPHDENLVKIGPADPEIICLKGSLIIKIH